MAIWGSALKFLKNKLALNNVSDAPVEELCYPDTPLTINEAVVHVLETAPHGLTVEQIYNKIVENTLYSFGAQNPLNVVRVEVDRACENSNYAVRASKNLFRFERNQEGEKIYFLLSTTSVDDVAAQPIGHNICDSSQGVETVQDFIENDSKPIATFEIINPSSVTVSVSKSISDGIIDLDEGKEAIREILNSHFQLLYGYSNINILWNAAQNSLSMFLNDNAINTTDDLWHLLCRAFRDEYVLNSPHIWQKTPDYPQSARGLIVNLARQNGGVVTREQIDDYFLRIKIGSPVNAQLIQQELLLFYAKKRFMLTETVNLTSERCGVITKALDKLFYYENVSYIVLRDISAEWYSRLPELKNGLPWTALLLQEVLRIRPNIGYRVLFSGLNRQSLDTLGAAIVPNKSEIATFADVVHRYSYEKYKLPHKLLAEDLRIELREAGMVEGNELIQNLHKALKDYRFGFTDENKMVKILER